MGGIDNKMVADYYKLIGDDKCFVCGPKNPLGLKIPFEVDRAAKTIRCEFTPGPEYQGFQGITHGGIITTLLDEAMVKLAFELGISAVTASIEVRFVAPLFSGERVDILATIEKEGKKLIEASAEAVTTDGKTMAKATAKLIKLDSLR